MKPEKPLGMYCYITYYFEDSLICTHYNDTKPTTPNCLKYKEDLKWNTYGRVLKCKQCLEEERNK